MQSGIWDANGAIPMWGPSAMEASVMEASVIEQMSAEVCGQVGDQMDEQNDERPGEPVDVEAVSAISHLSRREHEVLQELVDGKSHEAAAQELYISHHTFRTHVKNILTKLNAHSSIEAVSIAVCAGVRPSRLRDANRETDESTAQDSSSTE